MKENSPSELPTVLYVDDEQENLDNFRLLFLREYKVFTAISAAEGYSILKDTAIQVVIADQRMPEDTGVDFLSNVIQTYPHIIRMILTGYSDISAVIDAINKGKIYHYFRKPFDKSVIKMVIDNALEVVTLERENALLLEELKSANKTLEHDAEHLEQEVTKRTRELQAEVVERKRYAEKLERFNKAMLGREKRVFELKGEVNQCLLELGREAKYKVTDQETM